MAAEYTAHLRKPSVEHPVAIILGSGLGHLAGLVKPVRRIAYRDIPGFPKSAQPITGNSFEATIGTIERTPVVVYPGRLHLYEGYSALEVTSLVRHAHRLGCRIVLFVCATGAIPQVANTGLGLISDHINLTGLNPLVGFNGQEPELSLVSSGFVDMADLYTKSLRQVARTVAQEQGITLGEGVLAGVLGPSFETQAEVAMLRTLGASYVGRSCVCEAIMAHALGMGVLGLTLAANYAGEEGISHQTVLSVAATHAQEFERLICGILKAL
ncbi:MAG: purine-nucleoside phosphorylase [Coriobacteriales bacterium]|nr:purine-nucleoside phosphorylase [Coriobacteriales bacterium]